MGAEPIGESVVQSIVIDEQEREGLWKHLLPGAEFRAPNNLGIVNDGQVNWEAKHPTVLVIYAGLRLDEREWKPSGWGDGFRGVDLALRLLQEPDRIACPILLVSFESEDEAPEKRRKDLDLLKKYPWLVRWKRLPATPAELQSWVNDISTAFDKTYTKTTLRVIAKETCKNAVENENRRYRHRQGNFCAAIRLLLGALLARHIDKKRAEFALKNINNRLLGQPATTLRYNFGPVQRYMKLLNSSTTAGAKPGQGSSAKFKALVIDDEYHSFGWDVALDVLLNPINITLDYAPTVPEDLETRLANVQLLFIDFNLGNDHENGLQVLRRVRKVNPFIPTILFTGSDEPLRYVEALEHGATTYFPKEMSDPGDRDSLQYFDYFKGTIAELRQFRPESLAIHYDIWRRCQELRQHSPHNLGEKRNKARKCITSAASAVEQALFWSAYLHGIKGARPEGKKFDADPNQAGAAKHMIGADLDVVFKLADESYVAVEQIPPGKSNSSRPVSEATGFITRAKHHKLKGIKDITILDHCDTALNYLAQSCATLKIYPLPARAPVGAVAAPDGRVAGSQVDTHQSRSATGAVRFLLGYYLIKNPSKYDRALVLWNCRRKALVKTGEPPAGDAAVETIMSDLGVEAPRRLVEPLSSQGEARKKLLLIDDTAHEDGWQRALGCALTDFAITHTRWAGNEPDLAHMTIEAKDANTILLDLCLPDETDKPSEKVGWELLKALVKAGIDVPIILFTADNNVLWARRSYRSGAQGFFPKNTVGTPTSVEVEFFTGHYYRLRQALDVSAPTVSRSRAKEKLIAIEETDQIRGRILELLNSSFEVSVQGSFCRNFLTPMVLAIFDLSWIARDPEAKYFWANVVHSAGLSHVQDARPSFGIQYQMAKVLEKLMKVVVKSEHDTVMDTSNNTRVDPNTLSLGKLIHAIRTYKDSNSGFNKIEYEFLNKLDALWRDRNKAAAEGEFFPDREIWVTFLSALEQIVAAINNLAQRDAANRSMGKT